MFLTLLVITVTTTLFLYLAIVEKSFKRSKHILFPEGGTDDKFLIVTAHPDDEVMFFTPTIASLLRLTKQDNIFLICLSNGNRYGCGKVRESELMSCCLMLGLNPQNIQIINDRSFEDGEDWNHKIIKRTVTGCILQHNIDKVISFDCEGISMHTNHCAIGAALPAIDPESLKQSLWLAQLKTISLFRKYSSLADLWISLMKFYQRWPKELLFVSSPSDFIISQRAMSLHASQYVWYRKLYMLFSRYTFINTLCLRKIK